MILVLQMRDGFLAFLEDLLLPGKSLRRKYSRCRSFMNGSSSLGL